MDKQKIITVREASKMIIKIIEETGLINYCHRVQSVHLAMEIELKAQIIREVLNPLLQPYKDELRRIRKEKS